MRRILLAAALVTAVVGSADAATTKKKHYVRAERPLASAPVFTPSNTRPAWAAPQQCFTDDGYGRFTPCEGGGKGY